MLTLADLVPSDSQRHYFSFCNKNVVTNGTCIPGFTFHRGGCFFALISIFTVFSRFFLHIHLLCMMGRFYFQTIIQFSVITGCEVRK